MIWFYTLSLKINLAVQNGGKQLKDKAGSCKKSATKKGKASAVDLRKVSTARGMSFAPDEFAFTAPNNLASFVFKPLSPASCENFLFSNNPDETAAFVATDAGRYMYITVDFLIFAASFLFAFWYFLHLDFHFA